MSIRTYLLVFFCMMASILFSQTPPYYHYTHSDGLASSTVFQIVQDHDGFIWFATINGISRFDGKHFTNYSTNDGLNSNSIIALAVGDKGELYIGNYERGINVLRNNKIENYISEERGEQSPISYMLYTSTGPDRQKIYAYKSEFEMFSVTENSLSDPVYKNIPHTRLLQIKLAQLPNGEIISLTFNGLYSFNDDSLSKMNIEELPDTEFYCLTPGNGGSFFVGSKGMIYHIHNKRVIEQIKVGSTGQDDVMDMMSDSNNNLWFSVMSKGFYCIPNGTHEIIDIGSKMGLEHTLVNNYLEDQEGNIWISTYGKGVFCLNNLYLRSFSEEDGLSSNSVNSIIKADSNKLLIGTFNGLNILENKTFIPVKIKNSTSLTDYIYGVEKYENDVYVCGSLGLKETVHIDYNQLKFHFMDFPSFCKTSRGIFLLGAGINYLIVSNELYAKQTEFSKFTLFGDSININRVNKIVEDPKKNIWVGSAFGLCKLTSPIAGDGKTGWEKTFFSDKPVLDAKINAIHLDKKNKVWFAGEKGIANYDLQTDSILSFTSINGYDLSSSTSIVSDDKNRIWIGNMKGLFMLDSNSVTLLNSRTGLPSDEVLSLHFDAEKNMLYVGTNAGITFLDITQFDRYHPTAPQVKITNLKAGDSVYTNCDKLVFKPNMNDISINFRGIHFSSPGSVVYRYKLNKEWIVTEHDFLNFISLKPGDYQLQIEAKAQNTGWGKPGILTFEVKPHIVETVWFKLLVLLIFLISLISMLLWRMNRKTKKMQRDLELTERINELKHQALSAMMNPHFISNALNSVQYLVNSKKYEEANEYIAMMAKLMRMNLNTAGSGFILLSDEIARLFLYLDLEKLRFQESFTYELITGTDVDTANIMIPNMIIQPFTENSLRHGLANSGVGGLLSVSFLFKDVRIESAVFKCLVIKITDNGIGIEQAKKEKQHDHISKGIQIVEERLRLLSTKMNLPEPIMFEDLSNRKGDSRGTEVIICLPPPLYKIKNS